MSLFGKKKDPKQMITKTTAKVRDSQAGLRKEKRQIDRHIFTIKDEEDKARKTIRLLANKGMSERCRDLAAAIVNTRRSVRRLEAAKLNIDIVDRQLEQLRADMRLSGAIETSNEVTTGMSELIKVPELSKSMKKLSKELFKMGVLEERVDEVVGACVLDDEEDGDIDEEISKILTETTLGPVDRRQLTGTKSVTKSLSVDDPISRKQPTSVDRGRRSMSVVEQKTSSEDRRVRQKALLT